LSTFGDLILEDILLVTTPSSKEREFHVFLFEKIIISCKMVPPTPPNGMTVDKQNSTLERPFISESSSKKDMSLLLKGRIHLTDLTLAIRGPPRHPTGV
jgi:cell division control protein 24